MLSFFLNAKLEYFKILLYFYQIIAALVSRRNFFQKHLKKTTTIEQ